MRRLTNQSDWSRGGADGIATVPISIGGRQATRDKGWAPKQWPVDVMIDETPAPAFRLWCCSFRRRLWGRSSTSIRIGGMAILGCGMRAAIAGHAAICRWRVLVELAEHGADAAALADASVSRRRTAVIKRTWRHSCPRRDVAASNGCGHVRPVQRRSGGRPGRARWPPSLGHCRQDRATSG